MITLGDIAFCGLLTSLFSALIIGTRLRWKFLIDPPVEWKNYTGSRIKKRFGTDFLIGYNYIVGILGTGISLFLTVLLIILYT